MVVKSARAPCRSAHSATTPSSARGSGAVAGLGVVALTVLAAYRRKGLGEALLRALLDAAAKIGLGQVWLSVRPDNTPALHLYEKLGFLRETSVFSRAGRKMS